MAFEWLADFFGSFGGEGFGAATVSDVSEQEALGQSIVDRLIYEQSRAELDAANERAALAFEGAYQHATAGPAWDPTADDPYGFQQILGRAIVSQAQGALADDTPLHMTDGADAGSYLSAALGAARQFFSPAAGPETRGNVPRQVFSNRPGQGGGYVISPSGAPSVAQVLPDNMGGLVVLGLIGVGLYVALK